MNNSTNRPIKVLYVIDTLETGGAEKSLVEITMNFSNTIPFFVCIYEGDHLKKRLEDAGIEVYSMGVKKKYGYKQASENLEKIVNEIKPDLIHATLYRSEYITRKLKPKLKIPLINSFVSNSYSKTRYDKLSFLRRLKLKAIEQQDRLGVNRANHFISNSKTIRNDNSKILSVPKERITVIPRGRNAEVFQVSEEDSKRLSKELNISKDTLVLLNVGRLIESKGQHDLIKAFKDFNKEFSNSVLLIAGEGPFRGVLEDLIENLKLNESVKLLGNRSDVPILHNLAHLFVFPSYLEGMPGSLIEAMFSKTPILCSNIPENTEVIEEELGTTFELGNIEDLKRKLFFCFHNRLQIQQKAKKAFSVASDEFEIRKVATAYEELYRQVIKKNK